MYFLFLFLPQLVMGGISPAPVCVSSILQTPNVGYHDNQLFGISGSSASDVWAVGYYQHEGVHRTLVEHFDGSMWSLVPSPNNPIAQDDTLVSVSVYSATDAWAVGGMGSRDSQDVPTRNFAVHWNGSSWNEVTVPRVEFGPGDFPQQYLTGVSVNSANPNDVWVVGDVPGGIRNEPTFAYAEHWNGSSWHRYWLPSNSRFPSVFGVAVAPDGEAWAVGGGVGQGSIAHWDGTRWGSLPSSDSPQLFAVDALLPNDAWAAGVPIEHYNGSVWQRVSKPLRIGILKSVSALSATNVWAAGDSILRWDGTKWHVLPPPNSGFLYGIQALPSGSIAAGVSFDTTINAERTLSVLTTCH